MKTASLISGNTPNRIATRSHECHKQYSAGHQNYSDGKHCYPRVTRSRTNERMNERANERTSERTNHGGNSELGLAVCFFLGLAWLTWV